MKKELTFAISGVLILSLFACKNGNTNGAGDKGKDSTVVNNQGANSEADLLPNLLEIGATIKNSGLTYFPGLTNPISDASKYNTAYEQDLNLGIYFADLSYCTLNKQNEQSTNYLKAVKAIADAIGIGQVFGSNAFAQRYRANLDNEDSLTAIVADLQTKTDQVLKTNIQSNMRVVIYAGAWVENMYIGAKVNAQTKGTVGFQIIEQMTLLDNILKVLDKYKANDSHLQDLFTDLANVSTTFHSFDEVKNYNPDNKQKFMLSDEHTKKITEVLETLHAKYIK